MIWTVDPSTAFPKVRFSIVFLFPSVFDNFLFMDEWKCIFSYALAWRCTNRAFKVSPSMSGYTTLGVQAMNLRLYFSLSFSPISSPSFSSLSLLTHSVGLTSFQNFSSLAVPVCDWECLEDIWTNLWLTQLLNELNNKWMTEVIVEQPRLHRVC